MSDHEVMDVYHGFTAPSQGSKDALLVKCKEVIEGLHREIDERDVSQEGETNLNRKFKMI